MSDLIFTEPKRKYLNEYLKACREAVEADDTEWMPIKKVRLKYFRFFALRSFKRMKSGKDTGGYPLTITYWCIEDGRFIGECQIRPKLKGGDLRRIGNVGYSVRPSERGKGHGRKILAYAVKAMQKNGIYPIIACCHKDNPSSAYCLVKEGFRLTGSGRDDEGKPVNVYELRYEKDESGAFRPCELSCGAVVFTRVEDGVKYMLVRSVSGEYGFPKGHIEGDETERQTALREVKEETDLNVVLDADFCVRTSFRLPQKQNVMKHVTYFLAEYKDQKPKPQPGEISGIELLDHDSAYRSLRHADLKALLDGADAYIREKLI